MSLLSRCHFLLLAFSACCLVKSVQAETAWHYQYSARIGVIGAGVEIARAMSPDKVLRLNWQRGSYDGGLTGTQVDFDETFRLESIGLLLDWHPWYNSFRTTIGLVSNKNKLRGVIQNQGVLNINGHEYGSVELPGLSYDADFRKASIYLGLGWSLVPGHLKNWTFTVDSGLFIQGRLDLDFDVLDVELEENTLLASDVALVEGQVRDELDHLWLLPSFMLGLARTF